jgi:hypothetical protein
MLTSKGSATSRAFLRPPHILQNAMPPPIQHVATRHAGHAELFKHAIDLAFKRSFFLLAEAMRGRSLVLFAPAGLRYVVSRPLQAYVISNV